MTGPPAPVCRMATRTQNERAHDPLAQLRFGDQQGAQPIRWNDQRLHPLQRGCGPLKVPDDRLRSVLGIAPDPLDRLPHGASSPHP
jgi:hypothetical protein